MKYIFFFLRETKIDVPKNEEIFVKLRGLLPQVKNIKSTNCMRSHFRSSTHSNLAFRLGDEVVSKLKSRVKFMCSIHGFGAHTFFFWV